MFFAVKFFVGQSGAGNTFLQNMVLNFINHGIRRLFRWLLIIVLSELLLLLIWFVTRHHWIEVNTLQKINWISTRDLVKQVSKTLTYSNAVKYIWPNSWMSLGCALRTSLAKSCNKLGKSEGTVKFFTYLLAIISN